MTVSFGIPQAIWLFLAAAVVVVHCAKHGEVKRDDYNGPLAFLVTLLSGGLLYWGGFFGCAQ